MDTLLKTKLEQVFNFKLNQNQFKDLNRLFFEIQRRNNLSHEIIISQIKNNTFIDKIGGRNKFSLIKQFLIKLRFPLTSEKEKIDTKKIFLTDLKIPLKQTRVLPYVFNPEKILIEKSAADSYLIAKFKNKFPDIEIEELNYYGEYLKQNKFKIEDFKKPLIFIVNERWDFIKPCPCTKDHLGCNYWILNLGFGCPYDCSYCFLQQYSNFPGVVLPANLDDFFDEFSEFYKTINRPIRIGTGEFCDSLALDDITGYSCQLADFFRDKPVYFELKTKSNKIDNLLNCKASGNIVISWSLNPQEIIINEEYGTVSLEDRIKAAKEIQNRGFPIAFHFDPIIYFADWENAYKKVIGLVYSHLRPDFKWISLGTLRGTRKLKNIVEQRFSKTDIFYGELFLSEDKKLRYPKFLRKKIYGNIIEWIRAYDQKTPIYLCMEDKQLWQSLDKKLTSSYLIEKYLLKGVKSPITKIQSPNNNQ